MKTSTKALRDMMYGPPTKRPAGRPKTPLPETFEGSLKILSAPEQEFVKQVIAGRNQAQAYREVFPDAGRNTARVNSTRMVNRATVRHAIALGKQAGAVATIAGITYDLKAAHDELEQKIAAAQRAEQYTAVSSLMQQKLKLHGLLVDRQNIESSSLVVNISGVDTSRLTGRVIEHEEAT